MKVWWSLWAVVLEISVGDMMCTLAGWSERLSETLHFLMVNLLKVMILMRDFDDVLDAVVSHCELSVTVKWLSFSAEKLSLSWNCSLSVFTALSSYCSDNISSLRLTSRNCKLIILKTDHWWLSQRLTNQSQLLVKLNTDLSVFYHHNRSDARSANTAVKALNKQKQDSENMTIIH